MNPHDEVSDEQVGAYVDSELGETEWMQMAKRVQQDEALSTAVCELRQLKDAVHVAYQNPPAPPHELNTGDDKRGVLLSAVASVALLLLGSMLGWGMATWSPAGLPGDSSLLSRLAANGPESMAPKRIVMHVSTDDAQRLETALSEVEELLASYRAQGRPAQLEVVANYDGINLLRADVSPYLQRIRALKADYDGVSFLACARAIERLRLKGVTVNLVPEADIIPGALEAIVDRLQDGWVYIRV